MKRGKNQKKLKLTIVDNTQLVMGSEYDQQLEADEHEFADLRKFWKWSPGQQDSYLHWTGKPITEFEKIASATGEMIQRTAERVRLRFSERPRPSLVQR